MEETKVETHHKHWKMRLFVGLVILLFSFFGFIISDIREDGAWNYWRIMAPFFSICCLFLSWHLRKKNESMTVLSIWHEVLHWIGLIVSVYLISIFVQEGLIGRFQAGLVVLTLISLALFIAGIYIEKAFFIIAILLGLFAAGIALIREHLFIIMLPITLGVIVALIWIARKRF